MQTAWEPILLKTNRSFLENYSKIIRGKTKPRFMSASGYMSRQLTRLERAEKCTFCDNPHKLPDMKAKIVKADDPTFRNAVVLNLSARGTLTPNRAAAGIEKSYNRGKKTAIITGDIVHGLPFLMKTLATLTVPVAVVLAAEPLYSERAAKSLSHIADVQALTIRWSDPGCAEHFGHPNYVETVRKAISAAKGEIIIRIPIVPGHIECDGKTTLNWLAENNFKGRVQLMLTHKPRASEHAPELEKPVSITEFNDVVSFGLKTGLDIEGITPERTP